MFRQAKQNRIFQDVVDQIQEAIVDGRIKPGQQLPPERELKDQFNVSRGTLREALRVLEQKGLIVIKTGVAGGAIVRGVTTEQINENLGMLIRYRKVSLENLAEFREGIEGLVAAIAAERASDDDIVSLQALLDEAKQNIEQGQERWDEFIRVDEEIHMEVARITENTLFKTILETIYYNIHTYYESFLPLDDRMVQENFQDLADLVAAIGGRDAVKAKAVARDHVRRFNSYMQRKGSR